MRLRNGEHASTGDLYALYKKYEFKSIDQKTGDPYKHDPNATRPAPGFKVAYRNEDELSLRATMAKAGLPNFAELLRFEIYRERPEKRTSVYPPIVSHVIKMWLGVMRKAVAEEADNPGKEDLAYMLQRLAPKARDEDYYHMPRIKVTDLPEDVFETKLRLCSTDLLPAKIRDRFADADWEKLFNEIPEEKYKAVIKKAMEDVIEASRKNPGQGTFEDGLAYTRDGGAHEVSHFLAGHFSAEEETELLKIFMGQQNMLFVKNMLKAMNGIRDYRKRTGEEPSRSTLVLLFSVFVSEMLCDYMAIYIKEKAGEDHIYKRKGVQIPPELRKLLDSRWLDLERRDREKTLAIFSEEEERNSKLIAAQKISATLGLAAADQ